MEASPLGHRWKFAVLVSLWLGGATATAQPDVEPSPASPAGISSDAAAEEDERRPWSIAEIVNPSRSAEQREPGLDLLIREADQGGRTASALLGRLYFMGENHPASPVPRDLERAEHYLQIALTSGDLTSMYWLAELELANGRPIEAAIWTQSYIQLREHPEEDESGAGYIPSLLVRIGRAPGGSRIDEEALAEYVAGFVQTHGHRLRQEAAGPDHRGTGWPKYWADPDREECNVIERISTNTNIAQPGRTFKTLRFRTDRQLYSSGMADFLLRISPDGRVSNAMLVSSLPDVDYGLQTKPVAESMTFNEVPSDCRMRWAMAPINLINSPARLR